MLRNLVDVLYVDCARNAFDQGFSLYSFLRTVLRIGSMNAQFLPRVLESKIVERVLKLLAKCFNLCMQRLLVKAEF